MTRLTSVYGSFRARVMAARLEDEGFDVQLRGALDSPYALTVGDMARDRRVRPRRPARRRESYVLLVTEVDESRRDPRRRSARRSALTPRAAPLGRRACAVRRDRGPGRARPALVLTLREQRGELRRSWMRRNARRGRARSRSATSSWSAVSAASSVPSTLAPSFNASAETHARAVLVLQRFADLVGLTAEHRVVAARRARRRRRTRGTSRRGRRRRVPTSATSSSTSYGFISCVKTCPRVCAYALASSSCAHVFT